MRKGFGLAWGMPMPTPKQLEALGDPYRPYRSVVAWYCWRAAELYGGAAKTALTSWQRLSTCDVPPLESDERHQNA